MARPKSLIPKLCVDKSRNRAFCKVDGKFVTLGPVGSPAAQAAYGKLLQDLAMRGVDAAIAASKQKQPVPIPPAFSGPTLNDLLLEFVTERLGKYAKPEKRCFGLAIRIARELYRETPAEQFDVLRLRTVREAMVLKVWSRGFINKQVARLKVILRWAVGWKLFSQTAADALGSVDPLEPGETSAVEHPPRRAVPEEHIAAVRPLLTERYRDIVDLLCLTGARVRRNPGADDGGHRSIGAGLAL